jgi:asparagine synthase (glutamine-hydrolysing)
MNNYYTPNQPDQVLKSDLAGELPLYLYWPQDKKTLLYSKSITELLNDSRGPKSLKVSGEGISFLLQSGVVPPPKTAYQDIYIVSIGDTANVHTVNGKVEVTFQHEFPFMNANRLQPDEMQPDEDLILEMLAEATISRIDESKPSFLFHSAGKDSNSIALALAEAGWQDKVTLITHKSKGKADESEISARIAKQLGFKHQILHEVDQLQSGHKQTIENYFVNAPFPCTDNVSLAYPLYAEQIPELKGANIIDGGGNDVYMMTPPSSRDQKIIPISKYISKLSTLRSFIPSESIFIPLLRAPAEWCGMGGFSFLDTKNILKGAVNVYDYWNSESKKREDWDLFDFKTDLYATTTISEVHMRKFRNFTDVMEANSLTPFSNETVTKYFAKMPEEYLFDRKSLKNKLILRKILKERLGLDSDAVGKMGWTYDSHSIVIHNWGYLTDEIYACTLWHQPGLVKLVNRLRNRMDGKGWGAGASGRLLYRIYLISAWFNYNTFLQR